MSSERLPVDAFYQDHLERVSRSFAFCIAEVRPPASRWIGLAYLLCRLVDTIEDSAWKSSEAQQEAFAFLKNSIERPPVTSDVDKWVKSFPPGLPAGEHQLVAEAGRFIADVHLLPKPISSALKPSILNMILGMTHMCEKFRHDSEFKLNTLIEVNQYCFFVAGVVGELLTEVFRQAMPAWKSQASTYLDGFHFGFFLQKINILKDQQTDEASGRYFVPDRSELRASLPLHAKRALAYLLSLPETQTDIRIFCAWSLFIGLASMPHIDRSWREKSSDKISRLETAQVLTAVQGSIDSNAQLQALFESYLPGLEGEQKRKPAQSGDVNWLAKIYQGHLTEADFLALGLC